MHHAHKAEARITFKVQGDHAIHYYPVLSPVSIIVMFSLLGAGQKSLSIYIYVQDVGLNHH